RRETAPCRRDVQRRTVFIIRLVNGQAQSEQRLETGHPACGSVQSAIAAIVVRADISAAREKFADDVVMSGASGGQQRCVAAFIRSVDVGTVVEQPADDFEAAVGRSDVEAYGSVRIEFRSVLEELLGTVEAAALEFGVE